MNTFNRINMNNIFINRFGTMIDLLLLIGIVIALTLVVYVLVILSTKEKSFEEALKEQRQKLEQEHAQQKADKQHKKNKVSLLGFSNVIILTV